jgi:DNA-binding transcriptional ArsR family regulator
VLTRLRDRLDGTADADAIVARLAEPLGIANEPAPVEELFWAVRRFLERLADDGPTIVVIDDIHWADSTVLDLLEHLADWIHGVPLLLLALARPELLDTRSGWGGGKPDATTFLLEPLPSDQTDQLVEVLFEGAHVPEAARKRIAAAADGNPLFAEQVIEMLLDDGLVRRLADGSFEVERLDAISVPPTIQALLAARLDRLSDSERRTIERASVVGKEFGQREVSELTPADGRPAVPSQLMALVRKELIRPERRRDDGGETFRFRHLLIRDAAYDSLPKAERAGLHEQFANWLESSAGERVAERDEIVGYHLAQAREYRLALGPDDATTKALALRAGRKLLAAGERAAARDDFLPAERLLQQAAALLVDDPPARFEALLALVAILFGREYQSMQVFAHEAHLLAGQIGEAAVLRAELWEWAATSFRDPSFRFETVRPKVNEAVRRFREAGDIPALLDALEVLSIVDLNAAHWSDAAASARLGIEVASEHGFVARRSDFTRWFANALLWGNSDANASLATLEGLLEVEPRRSIRSAILGCISALRGILGDAAGSAAADAESLAINLELGERRYRFRHAFAQYALGNLPGAIEASKEEVRELERINETGQRSTMLSIQAWVRALMGDHDEAVRVAEEGRRLGSPDDAVTQILWRMAEGLAKAHLGDLDTADRLTAEALEVASATDSINAADAWEARARVLWKLGRRDEMLEAAARARELHAQKGAVNFLKRLDEFLAEAGVQSAALAEG